MGAAQRNPSILFEAAYVPLGLLRVLRRQKTRLRVKDCLFENRSRSLIIGLASSKWDLQRDKISSGTNPQCPSRSFGGQVDALFVFSIIAFWRIVVIKRGGQVSET